MRITCPECETVLRPAQPIAPGKKVKCPRCGTTFSVVDKGADTDRDEAEAPPPGAVKKKPDGAAPQPARKPGTQAAGNRPGTQAAGNRPGTQAAGRPAPPAPSAPPSADDDDGPGTYGLQGGSDAPKKEGGGDDEDDGPPEIDYAPDTSIKDLRGPAQAAVIQPTNFLIALGVAGFLGWLALLIICLIPVLFPIETDEGSKDAPKDILKLSRGLGVAGEEFNPGIGGPPPGPKEKVNVSFYNYTTFGWDMSQLAMYAWFMFILMMLPILLGMIYAAVQTYGAVSAQNLESRQWGLVSSIMAFIPISMGGFFMVLTMILSFILNMLLDDTELIDWTVYGIGIIIGLLSIAAGIYCLMTLIREDVIAGYEFVPDIDDIKADKKGKSKKKKKRRGRRDEDDDDDD
jgi:predicted Zn finger-like uncharacterized protein